MATSTAKRSTYNGKPQEHECWDRDGVLYPVPLYTCRAGESAVDVAALLGGVLVPRREVVVAESERRVSAAVHSGGTTYLVTLKEAI